MKMIVIGMMINHVHCLFSYHLVTKMVTVVEQRLLIIDELELTCLDLDPLKRLMQPMLTVMVMVHP